MINTAHPMPPVAACVAPMGTTTKLTRGSMSVAARARPRSSDNVLTAQASSGYSHRMTFKDHPRLIGPIQRGTPAWQRLYAARSASERTNSYDQEVIANAHPLRMRGLKAFRFAGAIRTLAQLLCRALNFVLDVTLTLSKASVAQT